MYIGAKAISERRVEHVHGFLRTGNMVMMMLIMNIMIMHMTWIMDMMMFLILMLWMLSMTMLFTDEQNCQKSIGKHMIFSTCVYIFLVFCIHAVLQRSRSRSRRCRKKNCKIKKSKKKKKKSMRESAPIRPTRLLEVAQIGPTRSTPPTPWISIEINRN